MRRLNGVVFIIRYVYRRHRILPQLATRDSKNVDVPIHGYGSFSSSSSSSVHFFRMNQKITQLIRTGHLCQARDFFDKMQDKNTVTWNSMISGYVKRREMAKARNLFDEMPQRDVVSWNTMISGYVSCGGIRFLEEARCLFDQMPNRDCISWNTMISGYAKNSKMDEALYLFNIMPERNIVSWNAMVTGFLQNGDVAHAIDFFERMPEKDSVSLSALVSGLISNGEFDAAARVLMQCGSGNDRREDLIYAYNTLIGGYGQRGKVELARRLFDQIPDCHDNDGRKETRQKFQRNIVSWNSMIMCYVKAGDVVSARKLFDQMKQRDAFSWNTMISGYVHASNMDEASNLFGKMPNPDTLSWNMMVSGYAQMGKLELACDFFDRMPQKNLVSWNSIIAAFEKNEDFKGAAEIFVQMQGHGQMPDRHTLSSLLCVSTGLVNLQLGMQTHQIVWKTVIPDPPINNSLITMYSSCGAITDARKIFDKAKLKLEVITWNAMIGGYASHGYAKEALSLFESMKGHKIHPTYITFIAVLNACAHGGLVEEAQMQFESMVSDFNIEPRIEHYASLVDVIGRQGQLDKAMQVIKGMPFEPDNVVWGALLGACRVHKNVDLARIAAEALMRLEPESSAAYVLLYNMYVDMGRWEEAAGVRLMMDGNKIKKARASSWVDSSYRSEME